MTQPSHILPHLYTEGYSACLDYSKYFQMFTTLLQEYQFFGIVHPSIGEGRVLIDSDGVPACLVWFGCI